MTNRRLVSRITLGFAVLSVSLIVPSLTFGAPIVFSATGANPAAIQATVDAFRALLGGGNVVGPNGSFGGVRREINWDGVPDAFSAPNNLPANFFNVNSPRGVIFSTPGTGFQVSANAAAAPVRFDNINATYSSIFQTFSPQRLFTSLGSNIVDINFLVAGTNTPAFVSGFGAVFTDVDVANGTSIQMFDTNNVSLGTFVVVPSNNGLSFLGIFFNAGERVGRLRITSGNAPLGPNDNPPGVDVAVMDDFIYSEPAATNPCSGDTTPPSIVCPTSITRFTDSGQVTATVNPGTPAASDNCSASVTGVRSDGKALNAPYPIGVTTIIWTAQDPSGNVASCSQTIVVMAPSGQRRLPD